MDPTVAIECSHLSKGFGHAYRFKGSDTQALAAVFAEVFGRRRHNIGKSGVFLTTQATGQLFSNFNLTVEAGTVLGVVGPSGSGKTVLLKLLAGALPFDEGQIAIRGVISSLLEERDGLDGNRTMRENVLESCRLERLDRSASAAYYERVVRFAELAKFTEIPIRLFSTGMRMRFLVAMALEREADVFLIDDVLAVGDLNFQERCEERLRKLSREGSTIVLVMQDETILREFASRIIRLVDGTIAADSAILESPMLPDRNGVCGIYQWSLSRTYAQNEYLTLVSVESEQRQETGNPVLHIEATAEIRLPQTLRPAIDVVLEDRVVFRSIFPQDVEADAGSGIRFGVDLPLSLLAVGTYIADLSFVSVDSEGAHSLKTKNLLSITVKNRGERDGAKALLNPDLVCVVSEFRGAA